MFSNMSRGAGRRLLSTAAGRESIKALADGPAGAFAAGALGMGVIGALMNFRSRKPTAPMHPDADKFKLETASKGDAATASEIYTPSQTTSTPQIATSVEVPTAATSAVKRADSAPLSSAQWHEVALIVRKAESILARPAPAISPPTKSAIAPLPDKCLLHGRTGGWRVFTEGGSLFAAPRSGIPLRLTPEGVGVGAVMLGENSEILVELRGYSPDDSGLHRIRLPAAKATDTHDGSDDGFEVEPEVVPDTSSPVGDAGSVSAWMTCGSTLSACGALVRDSESGAQSLYLRSVEPARIGSAAWRATCKRLKLPEPPIDPHGPQLYSEWRKVATWDATAKLTVAGYVEGLAWVHDAGARMAVAFSPEGAREMELPL